jgi:two-component system, NtrC family, sensor histidine kinase KinB
VSEEVARRRRDATESRRLRRVNDTVERHAAELDALFEGMTEGVLVADARGKIVLVNRMAREVLGSNATGPLTTVDDLRRFDIRGTDGAPLPYDELPLVRALRGDRFTGLELLHVHPNGQQRRLVCAGCAASAPGGELLVMVLLHDVSELRRVESERDEALALISHDLRTPLSTIALRSELLRKALLERGDVEQARTAELIVRGARRISAMTDELGVASAIKRLDLTPVHLLSLVADAVEQAVPPEERGRVQLEPCADLPPVAADAERLERAVANLASNAIKYSPANAPISIRVVRRGREVVLTVEDGGVGIPPEDLPHLFQKTFRARTAGPVEGLGLGLYIVRLIVEAHGGRVWAESQVGRGSRFHVALPIASA